MRISKSESKALRGRLQAVGIVLSEKWVRSHSEECKRALAGDLASVQAELDRAARARAAEPTRGGIRGTNYDPCETCEDFDKGVLFDERDTCDDCTEV